MQAAPHPVYLSGRGLYHVSALVGQQLPAQIKQLSRLPNEMEKKALVIVDVQKGFLNEHTQHIPSLVENLQNCYKLVFATQFVNPPETPYRRWMNWKRFAPDSQEEVPLAFKKAEHVKVVEKNRYTCVTVPFLSELEKSNIEEVHVCGMDTDVCCTKIAVDLFEDGRFKPIVLTHYCASHYGEVFHSKGLDIIARFIGKDHIFTGEIHSQ